MKDTKKRILLEAVQLFARYGYDAVSVERIAEAVGIKAPSLYKHYGSKREIFDSVLREMERRDAENAAGCGLPQETKESAPEAYEEVSVPALLTFCRRMFRYWTEDGFASAFRRMLTVEQYRSGRMNALYQQYIGAGPLDYTAGITGSREAALTLYAPMVLLYAVYDGTDDKSAVFAALEEHLESWYRTYQKTEGKQ